MILWGITLALQVVLLANNAALDTYLWRTTRWVYGDNPPQKYSWVAYKAAHAGDPAPRPFYMVKDPPLTRTLADGRVQARLFAQTEVWWTAFKSYAENMTMLVLAIGVAIVSRRRWKAGAMFLGAALLAGGVSSLLRIIAGRYRPVAPPGDGINHWEFFRGFHAGGGTNLSWPSGHATAAFAAAAILTYLSPPAAARAAKWFFVIVASGTAYARVVQEAHYYADVLMAAALGWTVAWWTCRLLDRLIPDPPASGAGAAA
jgi:membrane-associated phospholipid phosphatase